jgi:spore germination cell wall hydrolase CwlJ-like protein
MARRGAVCAALIALWMSAATSLRPAAAADITRVPAAPQLAKEISLLARVVQAESSGEPEHGQRAVAWTVVNRLRQPEIYGGTITGVLLARHQYARPKPLRPDSPAYRAALRAATMAVRGEGGDSSRGATHFVRCDMRRKPAWVARFTSVGRIGQHCFYREKSR